jgi:hypothetical protein
MSAYLAFRYTKLDIQARQHRLLHLKQQEGASLGPDGLVQDTPLEIRIVFQPADITSH